MVMRGSFGKEDIGAELLPILTTGLYRDTLDTLREYVQNAIDANATSLEIVIDPDILSIADDGDGMSFDVARHAIRLGISEKNPRTNVGFRGIGIYSAFNLCDELEIRTRARGRAAETYSIRFNFQKMREELLKEEEKRKRGQPPSLYLEQLLKSAVSVGVDSDRPLDRHGTTATFRRLIADVYRRINEWDEVTQYLENVVPLPFRKDFRFKRLIEGKLSEEQHQVVSLMLQVGSQRREVFRPYYNDMFTNGGKQPPKFFNVTADKMKFGVVWVCHNDARRVLRDQSLRGVLIKKQGFSIADRHFLEPYFGRTVFNRRITGEMIVDHVELIPNAARSDFEHNNTRQLFFQVGLPRFIRDVSKWANEIQEQEKAREVMSQSSDEMVRIAEALPSVQRDRERLLQLNLVLSKLDRDLASHAKILRQIEPAEVAKLENQLRACQKLVQEALLEQRQTRGKLEARVVSAIAADTRRSATGRRTKPNTLIELLESYDLLTDPILASAIRVLDEDVLRLQLSDALYAEALDQVRETIEEAT